MDESDAACCQPTIGLPSEPCDCDACSCGETQPPLSPTSSAVTRRSAQESWRKLRTATMAWAPFLQRGAAAAAAAAAAGGGGGGGEGEGGGAADGDGQYPWVQLAGHQGNFRPGRRGTILKRLCRSEAECLRQLMDDSLRDFAPRYYGVVRDDEEYVEMQDLLCGLTDPALMDCKLGCRTYLESELDSGGGRPRRDMFEKMSEVDPLAPTPEERAAGAVTKARYMAWREQLSSTSTLAFRVDGIRKPGRRAPPCDFKLLRGAEDILGVLQFFTDCRPDLVQAYVARLRQLRLALAKSSFFAQHELIGSSLLFAHDAGGTANVWMIDFGKTTPSPVPLTHTEPWLPGNHEDGYLTGLDNLLGLFETLLRPAASNNAP